MLSGWVLPCEALAFYYRLAGRLVTNSTEYVTYIAGIQNNSSGPVGSTVSGDTHRPVNILRRSVPPHKDGRSAGGGCTCLGLPAL